MKATVIEILDVLDAIQCIKNSQLLSQDQRSVMLTELLSEMPLDMFCHQSARSRAIVAEIIERNQWKPKPESKEQSPHQSQQKNLKKLPRRTISQP